MVEALDKMQRTRELQRLANLRRIRQPRYEHWQGISTYLIPYAGRFLMTERDASVNRYQDIIDETGIHSVTTLKAGMMALRTNPKLPWFQSQTPDDALNLYLPVRKWLFGADMMARRILTKGRSYSALSHLYGESGTFGTGASIVVDDFDNVIHHHNLTAGEFSIATDSRGRVNTLYREFQMSVIELVDEFGIENVSKTVKRLYDEKTTSALDSLVDVVHVIEPRRDNERIIGNRDSRNMPWKSCYFEAGEDLGGYLRIGGFRDFRCIVPRWDLNGGDFWGEGPGTMALGSVRELQEMQLGKAKVIDYQTDPPKQIPTALKGKDRDLLPGGSVYYDQNTPNGGVRTAFEVPLRLDWAQLNIDDSRKRIERSFFVNLLQPITQISDTTQRTAEEIIQRRAEMLTVLGPVTIRYEDEIDKPLLEIVFARMFEENLLPPPPPELIGMPLDIEFIGPLAQALKAEQAQVNSRFRMHLGEIAALAPNAVDKYDADADIDRTSQLLGVDPNLIVQGEQVALIRQARAEAEKAAAQTEAMAMQAKTAKDLAAAGTSEQNALTDVMAGVSG